MSDQNKLITDLDALARGERIDLSVAEAAADEIKRLRAENERLVSTLKRIAGKAPFADDPWTIAREELERIGR